MCWADYQFFQDEDGTRLIKVERIEIDLKKIGNEINIEVTDDFAYTNSKEEKKLNNWKIAFYSSLVLGIAMLFY